MARNWANFLNEASRGYGLGFQRYQQYEDAQDARRRRALMTGAMEDLQDAERAIDPTLGDPQYSMPTTRKLPPKKMAGMPSATPIQQSAGPLQPGQVPMPPAGNRPAVGTVPIGAPGTEDQRDPIRVGGDPAATPRNVGPPGAGTPNRAAVPMRYTQNPLAPERAAPPVESDSTPAPAADQKTTDRAQAKQAAIDLQEIDPQAGRMVMEESLDSTRRLEAGGISRMDAYERAKNKLREAYVLDGNIEGLLGLDQRFSEMQRTKMLSHMEQAMQLYTVDPRAAANELYRAYTYLPDGADVDIRMGEDGTMYAMGYDDVTGEFRGGMPLTAERLSQLYRHYEDPVQFQQDMEALRAENEQRAYDRGQDNFSNWVDEQKLRLDAYEAAITRMVGESQAGYYGARAQAELAAAMGLPAGVAGYDFEDFRKGANDIGSRLLSWTDGSVAPPEPFQLLVDPEGKLPMSPVSVGNVATDLFASNPDMRLSADQSLTMGAQVSFANALASGTLQGTNAKVDRRMRDQWQKALERMPVLVAGYDESANGGQIELLVDGQEVLLPARNVPGLRRLGKQAEAGRQPIDAVTLLPPPAEPFDPVAQAQRTALALP